MFKKVTTDVSFSQLEQEMLAFWQEFQIFERSMEQNKNNKEFVFYDGPPFATGLPHYGHLLASVIKDVIPRFKTMEGLYVERRFGWDCHGLPVEYEIEKEMNLNGKKEIEAMGISAFNEACRSIVLRYTQKWQKTVTRIGRWVDFENDYKTMHPNYMESIWWVFKSIWDKDLIYEGAKVLPYCPRCATPLSNFETNQGYQEVQDPALTIRFTVSGADNTSMLAWTTTPWTLPANLALAVHPDISYLKFKDLQDQHIYIMAESRVPHYYKSGDAYEVIEKMRGTALVGMRYEPLMPYYAHKQADGCFRVVAADFVTIEDGTGIVHVAPAFGEDDYEVGKREGLGHVCPIDAEGKFTKDVPEYQGLFIKDADPQIIRRLKAEHAVVRHETCIHNYPFCWRCQSPLMYTMISTWFLAVEKIKEQLIANNQEIYWMPGHIKQGRFGKWLENVRDWAISRNRYWGAPIPVWKCGCGAVRCIGSITELEQMSSQKITDVHRHYIDDITFPCAACGQPMHRVSEVLDCWFESGSMPYAQHHYPFEHKEQFESHFPADFIAEGLDQTRGWFYTLLVISTALFNKPPFKNVIVNGLVLAHDGKKMSKSLKNYTPPDDIIEQYSADALRVYMLSSPVVSAEDLKFSDPGVVEVLRSIIIPLWNAYYFFVSYANIDGWTAQHLAPEKGAATSCAHQKNNGWVSENLLDRWILSVIEGTTEDIRYYLDQYDLQKSVTPFVSFIELLTNWYIRRSRRRFWASGESQDKQDAYTTLYMVLKQCAKLAAPFMPFISDAIYQNLRLPDEPVSVHLCAYPRYRPEWRDSELEKRMQVVMQVVSMGRYLRTQAQLKTRQPLQAVHCITKDQQEQCIITEMRDIIIDELNVKEVVVGEHEDTFVTFSVKPNMSVLGPKYGKDAGRLGKQISLFGLADIKALEAGSCVDVVLEHGSIAVSREEVYINRAEKEGFLVKNEGTLTIVLDPTLSSNLIHEGLTRDFINKVQKMRKDAGLDFVDRIHIEYVPTPALREALTAFYDYLSEETLAVSLQEKDTLSDGIAWDINGEKTMIAIKKAE